MGRNILHGYADRDVIDSALSQAMIKQHVITHNVVQSVKTQEAIRQRQLAEARLDNRMHQYRF